MKKIYGGIEAGGTKFVCMVASSPEDILAETRFPTTTPEEAIQQAAEFFKPYTLEAVGIGTFGPVDLNPSSPTYGFITSTPKKGWQQTDLRGNVVRALKIPVAFDTDVNAAAFGEQYWVPENRGVEPFLYITVGTGIGVGAVVNGKPLHGLIHPEAGHFLIPHDLEKDPFPGICPFHGDCLEGLASGPAIARRWGQPAETLPIDHPAWELETNYVALALSNLVLGFSPRKIVVGGGVFQNPALLPMVRRKVQHILNGYIQSSQVLETIDQLIVPPSLGNRSGVLGAIGLAATAVSGDRF